MSSMLLTPGGVALRSRSARAYGRGTRSLQPRLHAARGATALAAAAAAALKHAAWRAARARGGARGAFSVLRPRRDSDPHCELVSCRVCRRAAHGRHGGDGARGLQGQRADADVGGAAPGDGRGATPAARDGAQLPYPAPCTLCAAAALAPCTPSGRVHPGALLTAPSRCRLCVGAGARPDRDGDGRGRGPLRRQLQGARPRRAAVATSLAPRQAARSRGARARRSRMTCIRSTASSACWTRPSASTASWRVTGRPTGARLPHHTRMADAASAARAHRAWAWARR
jgi:hypothetical protein